MNVRKWMAMTAVGAAFAPGCDHDAVRPPIVRDPVPDAIASVSEDRQVAEAGVPLSEPLVIRVTDTQGDGVGRVEVSWKVTAGAGTFLQTSDPFSSNARHTRTDPDGIAQVHYTPWSLGKSSVVAEVPGLRGSPVTFTIDAGRPAWVPLDGDVTIYERLGTDFYGLHSRYILHEAGRFGLQYWSGHTYPGSYDRIDEEGITLRFDDDSRWDATASVRGDTLLVEYNLVMDLSGFDGGVYIRSP